MMTKEELKQKVYLGANNVFDTLTEFEHHIESLLRLVAINTSKITYDVGTTLTHHQAEAVATAINDLYFEGEDLVRYDQYSSCWILRGYKIYNHLWLNTH